MFVLVIFFETQEEMRHAMILIDSAMNLQKKVMKGSRLQVNWTQFTNFYFPRILALTSSVKIQMKIQNPVVTYSSRKINLLKAICKFFQHFRFTKFLSSPIFIETQKEIKCHWFLLLQLWMHVIQKRGLWSADDLGAVRRVLH